MGEGIDIYVANQTVKDWTAVKNAGIDWCYQKVSDGTTTRNPQSVAAGQHAGVLQGGYHFSQVGSAIDQAQLLLKQCRTYGALDLNPCLDLEDNPASLNKPNIPSKDKAAFAIAFGTEILASGNGYTLYANDSDWKNILYSTVMRALPNTFRWVARYGGSPTVTFDAHQYTSTGSVAGISSGGLDRNRGIIPVNNGGDMALSDDDLTRIKDALVSNWYDPRFRDNKNYAQVIQEIQDSTNAVKATVNVRYPDTAFGGDKGSWDIGENIRRIIRDYPTKADLKVVSDKLDQLSVGGVDLDALAAKVADLLAARLKD